MASPPVRRQILNPFGTTSTSQTLPSQTTLSPAVPTSSTTHSSSLPSTTSSDLSSVHGSVSSTTSSVAQSTSSIPPSPITPSSSVLPVSPTDTPQLPTSEPEGPATVTQTTSTAVPPPTGISGPKPKSFLENKPLSGFVFGLAGLAALIVVFVIITAFVRRRNKKRLLADASNFSFDPRDVEDGASDEKYSNSGLVGQHSIGHSHNDYQFDNRVGVGIAGIGAGGISRPGPAHSPPMPSYAPQDYGTYEGGHLTQYHNLGNIPVRYNQSPNPYDMYAPRNGGGYPTGQVHHDPYNLPGTNGDGFSNPEPVNSVPVQLQPGVRPAQAQTFVPQLSNHSPPMSNHAQLNSFTTSPSPPSYPQPSAPDKGELTRLPTPSLLPDTFGQRDSVDSADDAYDGAFLGPESPPESRTLHVANM